MPGLKLRKKTSKTSKRAKASKPAKRAKKTLKLKPAKSRKVAKARATRKPKQAPPRPDQTTVRLGPHHLDRHPIPAGLHVHPAPPMMAMKHPSITSRHH